jgi:hypothetical protein
MQTEMTYFKKIDKQKIEKFTFQQYRTIVKNVEIGHEAK